MADKYTPTIDRVTLPSGSTYYLKDKEARELIAELSNATHFLGVTTTELTDGATTNPITVGGQSVTAKNGDIAIYDQTEFIFTESTNPASWAEFGSTVIDELGDFAFVDTGTVTVTPSGTNSSSSVSFSGRTTDIVLGEATTFTNSSSAVTFGTHTTAQALAATVTATVPKPKATTKYISAEVGSVEIGVSDSDTAITGLGTPTTQNFVKSYPGTNGKLVTTSIPNVTNAGSVGTAASWTATVSDENLIFAWTTNTPTTPPTLGTAITAATGSVSSSGSGDTVLTGLGTAVTAAGVTGYENPTTDTFAQSVAVTTQPTVALTSATTTSSGAVAYVSALSTSGTNAVTFSDSTITAITELGAATAGAQTITVGTNDKVTAVTNVGTGTAAAQTFTGTEATYTVNPASS